MKANNELQREKQYLDINNAPNIFPAKDLPLYMDISYVSALKLAKSESFGFRFGEKLLFINRDKFINWISKGNELNLTRTEENDEVKTKEDILIKNSTFKVSLVKIENKIDFKVEYLMFTLAVYSQQDGTQKPFTEAVIRLHTVVSFPDVIMFSVYMNNNFNESYPLKSEQLRKDAALHKKYKDIITAINEIESFINY